MKKILSLVLALVLLLSVSATAFADTPTTLTDTSTVKVWKQYKVTAPAPDETFDFTVTKDTTKTATEIQGNMPTIEANGFSIAFTNVSATADKSYTINLPAFTRVGEYYYTISETAGTTAGVEYDSTSVRLKVTVLTQNGQFYRYVELFRIGEGANGSDVKVGGDPTSTTGGTYTPAFTNTFTATTPTPPSGGEPGGEQPGGDVTALSLQKKVTGNYGDTDQYFDFKVVFTVPNGKNYDNGTITVSETSYAVNGEKQNPTSITKGTDGTFTATFKLKADETLQFGSVPVGMTYAFTEENQPTDYTVTSANCSGTVTENQNIKATITNHRDKEIPTGISLDSLPYVIILATVAAAALLIVLKKKAKRA